MSEFFRWLLSPDGFMPHGHCYLWTPGIVRLHVISDALIALSYYSIPLTLAWFVRRRRDLDFRWVFVCFAVFILACGTSHVMEIWNVWHGNYWLSGLVKALTAAASIPTAILLTRLMPRALAIPSPSVLQRANENLRDEIAARRVAEEKLHEANILLEQRVAERTAELVRQIEERQRSDLAAARLAAIVESSSDSIVSKDLHSIVTSWNSGAERMFGYSASEMEGESITRIIPRERRGEEDMILARIERGESVEQFETQRVRKDGTLIEVSVTVSPIKDASNRVVGASKVARDITERKRIAESLRESEELFAKSFRLSPDCVVIVRLPERTVVRANEALCELWGTTPEEVIGKPSPDYTKWTSEEERLAFMRTLEERGECLNYDTSLLLADGRPVDFNISSRMITFNGESCVLSVMRDTTEKVRAEKARMASELRYRRLFETSNDGILILDAETGMVVDVNPFLEKILGFSHEQFLGKAIWELGFFRDIVANEHTFAELREKEYLRYENLPLETFDGHRIEVEFISNVYLVNETKVVQCNIRDVTARLKAEEALRAGEARMRLATEASAVGIWEWNVLSNQVRWDAQMFRIYGIAPTPDGFVAYQTWSGAVLPDDLPEQERVLQDTVQRIGRSSREFRIRRETDGECRYIQAVETVRTNDEGQAEWVVGTNLDITDRKEAEAVLLESEQRLRGILDTMFVFVGLMNPDGEIVEVNQAPLEAAGLRREEVLGRTVPESFWFSHSPAVQEQVRHAVARAAGGEVMRDDYLIRVVEGGYITIDTTFAPLRNASGQVTQVVGSAVDITERKAAERKIGQLNAELEQRVIERTAQLEMANTELEAFSYSVSHDLRAPLRAVDGFSQAVLEDYAALLPAEGQRYLQTIRGGAQKMGMLIDDLLTFSRLSRAPLTKREVETGGLVRSVLEDLAFMQEGRKIDLRIGELPPCAADLALLRQVWINLISNALKYTQKREAAVVEIGCAQTPEGDVFFVKDNGTGFDMRYAGKLFGVFQRLHRAEEFEGTGVGLAIVQRVIHRHGGRVWADAAVDRGAVFHFTLQGETKL